MGQILNTRTLKIVTISYCIIGCYFTKAQGTDYVSFPMMNQEIRHTLEEHGRQQQMHQKQLTNTGSETANESQWKEVKEIKAKIQKRLQIIDFTLQAIPTGYKLTQDAQKIAALQETLYQELSEAPYLVVHVFQDQITFVDDLQMTMRLIVGIVASYGSINQMERAERQTLLNYALTEVKRLKTTCVSMIIKVREVKQKLRLQQTQIQYQMNRDKQMVQDILDNLGI